jgi:uncharacterized protein (TIGR00255 family)
MTGFSHSEGQNDFCSWRWELKSVNARGLDIRCRVLVGYENLEKNIRDVIPNNFYRGNITVNLVVRWFNDKPNFSLNSKSLEEILDFLPVIKSKFPNVQPPTIDGLLSLRGVVESIDEDLADDVRIVLELEFKKSFEIALSSLLGMRIDEGIRLKEFLEAHLKEISLLIKVAEKLAFLQPKAIRKRLRKNIHSLLEDIPILSEDRLAQEVVLLISKSDIREELDRLKAHEQAARYMIKEGGPIGRKLDFLCQELNREVNTLCAKSADIELTQVGLEMKSIVEQFREQVQNIE